MAPLGYAYVGDLENYRLKHCSVYPQKGGDTQNAVSPRTIDILFL